MHFKTIDAYHAAQAPEDRAICDALRIAIDRALPDAEAKIWHAHPVWFLNDNPITGYSKLKSCIRLLFWSGQSFAAPGLHPEGSFKAAEARYHSAAEIDPVALDLWLAEARVVQYDYKNIIRNKGRLDRLD
ncbi:MAG: DUF1801 domain-containing protein [Rhodobacterales bacterium]|nr:DUF1801 domain-containing protein [Rhodobacterales bacterium]